MPQPKDWGAAASVEAEGASIASAIESIAFQIAARLSASVSSGVGAVGAARFLSTAIASRRFSILGA